jgi:dienelactone hydrolase
LRRSFGRFPAAPCPLAPEILGTLERPGYLIERLTFQSRPDVRVTANLYRPAPSGGRFPGVLSVHGHWTWARIDAVVQARCIGLARLGYVCLCVDAFGAGERAINPGPGTYHGGLIGASLWPVGTPLLGLQVYDNRRAVDYLVSRNDVDASRLAITGASGGGNQTLYAGATDDRLTAVVPVCGIGTYESYLSTACCVCEVNPGGLTYATTGDLLAMVAPRALLVVSATRDALQFSVAEAAKSVAYARERYRLLGLEMRIGHRAIESVHDYGRPMREAMYGWLERWLKNKGQGEPVSEPDIQTEDPQALRCYPDGPSRPRTIVTILEFARREGLLRLAALPAPPDHREAWEAESIRIKSQLQETVFGGFPSVMATEIRTARGAAPGILDVEMSPEPGIRLTGALRLTDHDLRSTPRPLGTVIFLDAERGTPEESAAALAPWHRSGFSTLLAELRAVGPRKPQTNAVAGVADHDEAEWAIWLNRPLLGQWVWDILQWVTVLDTLSRDPRRFGLPVKLPEPLSLVGQGSMSLAALVAAAFSPRVQSVLVECCLVSYVASAPVSWSGLAMGIIAPNILEVADAGHLGALVAPRRLIVASGVEVDGQAASRQRLEAAFSFTRSIYRLLGRSGALTLGVAGIGPAAL